MTNQPIDTLDIVDVDTISVDLWYPRNENRYKKIVISLMDVRAANDITISYDFDRDGWVIESDLHNPLIVDEEQSEELHEVAFITSWPVKLSAELLEDEVRSIYMNNLGDDFNYYAREAEDCGLVAVYNAGLAAGRQEKIDD